MPKCKDPKKLADLKRANDDAIRSNSVACETNTFIHVGANVLLNQRWLISELYRVLGAAAPVSEDTDEFDEDEAAAAELEKVGV